MLIEQPTLSLAGGLISAFLRYIVLEIYSYGGSMVLY